MRATMYVSPKSQITEPSPISVSLCARAKDGDSSFALCADDALANELLAR
jgi:hypothetical protein